MDVAEALAGGRYRLLSVLGEGGMATVYRGYDTSLDIERAIKILSPAMCARPNIRRRFEEEARTMARLHHRSIVAVQDVGVDGDRAYMVMELVEGGSLMDLLERRGSAFPPVQACDAVLAILAGLEVAHKKGVVHRDIKPHNVLVTAEGEMKVTDFGIAQVSDRGGATRTGTAMGTWAYMAPEQRSSAKHVDARADVYAVGASLYVLLTMEEPYDLYAAEIQESLFAKLPGGLPQVLRKACRFLPEERYASAAEMRLALAGVRAELASEAGADESAPLIQPAEAMGAGPEIAAFAGSTEVSGAFQRPGVGILTRSAPTPAPPPATQTLILDDLTNDDAGPNLPGIARSGTMILDASELPAARSRQPHAATMVDDGTHDAAPAPAPSAPSFSFDSPPAQAASRSPTLAAVAAVVLLALGGGAWFVVGGKETAPESVTAPSPAPGEAPNSAAGNPPVLAGSSPAPGGGTPTTAASAPSSAPTKAPAASPSPAGSATPAAAPSRAPVQAPASTNTAMPKPGATTKPAAGAPPTPAPAVAPPPAAASASAAETGTVFINSQPWSNLSVNGRSVGTTGWKGELPVGTHAFIMTAGDGASKQFTLTVSRGVPARFCWDFTKEATCSR